MRSTSHKENKSMFERFFSSRDNKGVAETIRKDISLVTQQPGWKHIQDYITERRETFIKRILHDPKAPLEELKARASEMDSLLDWIRNRS